MLPPRRLAVLCGILAHQPVAGAELARLMGRAQSTVQEHITLLLKAGLIERSPVCFDLSVTPKGAAELVRAQDAPASIPVHNGQ